MAGRKIDVPENDIGLPLMAASVLTEAGANDELMNELRSALLRKLRKDSDKEDKALEKKKRQALANAQSAEEERLERKRKQALCTHLKQDGRSTRLRGQVVTGDREGRGRQLVLVCGYCGKPFHYPPQEGQEAPPQALVPPADEIGNWGNL